jgi:hypothetical protein
VVQRHVLACWRSQVAESSAKWQQLARALCFHKHTLQATSLKAWREAAGKQQQARAAAEERLQTWQLRMLRCSAAQALGEWQDVAARQVELRQVAAQLVHILQRRRRQQVRLRATFFGCCINTLGVCKRAGSSAIAGQQRHCFGCCINTLGDCKPPTCICRSCLQAPVCILSTGKQCTDGCLGMRCVTYYCCSNTTAHLAVSSCQVLLHWLSLVQYHITAAPVLRVPALPHILLSPPARCCCIGRALCSTTSRAQMCLEIHHSLLLQHCALLLYRTSCCILLPCTGAAALVGPCAVPEAAGFCCCSAGWRC